MQTFTEHGHMTTAERPFWRSLLTQCLACFLFPAALCLVALLIASVSEFIDTGRLETVSDIVRELTGPHGAPSKAGGP